jgi:hypothetical protein
MRPHAALAYVDINNKEQPEVEEWKAWYQEATSSLAPALAYNSACSLAYRKEDWAKVKARLDTAFQDTRLKTAAPYDPELLKYAEARPDAKKYLLSLKNKKPTGWWAQFLSAVGF